MNEHIKKLFGEAKIEDALKEMQTKRYKDATLLLTRFNSAKRNFNLGTLSQADRNIENAKIVAAALDILDDQPIIPIVTNYQKKLKTNRPWWKRLFYFFFKNAQPDADFIEATTLSPPEKSYRIAALKDYVPLHFAKTLKGTPEVEPIDSFLQKKLQNTEGKPILLLAESGCGKTTILYKLFCT